MAEENVGVSTDLPVKRPREDEVGNEVSATTEAMDTETNTNTNNNYISSVIPGWFSEISPMWPGIFPSLIPPFFFCILLLCLLTKHCVFWNLLWILAHGFFSFGVFIIGFGGYYPWLAYLLHVSVLSYLLLLAFIFVGGFQSLLGTQYYSCKFACACVFLVFIQAHVPSTKCVVLLWNWNWYCCCLQIVYTSSVMDSGRFWVVNNERIWALLIHEPRKKKKTSQGYFCDYLSSEVVLFLFCGRSILLADNGFLFWIFVWALEFCYYEDYQKISCHTFWNSQRK